MVTSDVRLQSAVHSLYRGAYQEWAALITRPSQVRGIPLTAFVPLPIDGQHHIFLTVRDGTSLAKP